MKKIIFISFYLLVLQQIIISQSININKNTFAVGEQIVVSFTAPDGYAANAWIGIIPSSVVHGNEVENDKYDVSYQYLQNKTSGTLYFSAPGAAGNYDLRMHDTDNGGKEVTYVSFTVSKKQGIDPKQNEASISLNKSSYSPGEQIIITFMASSGYPDNAWIGIVPSSVNHGSEAENDKYDLVFEYLKGRASGEIKFSAPSSDGAFDIRMHDTDNNGKEITFVSFTVSSGKGGKEEKGKKQGIVPK